MLQQAEFEKQVSSHVMEVHRDDGRYRHIRFRKPGTMAYHFDLITWPGYLCLCGDMGNFVFQRLEDMFQFFRADRLKDQSRIYVNLDYWAEKLQAVDGNRHKGSAKEFDEDKFRSTLKRLCLEMLMEAGRGGRLDKKERRELWDAVHTDVLDHLEWEGAERAKSAAYEFSWKPYRGYGKPEPKSYSFQELWEYDFTKYTYHFQWCCFALAWGIKLYDRTKAAEAATQNEGVAA